MPDTRRNELARCLADIDRLLAEGESIAEVPDHYGVRETVLDVLIEFQQEKRTVEAELRDESK
jgi:hypothetical protein